MKNYKTLLPIMFIFFACKKNIESDKAINFQSIAKLAPPQSEIGLDENADLLADEKPKTEKQEPLKIIYSARIKYQIKELSESEKNIKELVKKMGGYISNSSQIKENNEKRLDLVIRIPVAQFDKFIAGSETESIFTEYKNISSEDVTEEFYHNELRIKSKKEAYEKYLAILKKAKNVKEVLEVEEQIRIIQEEIEAKQGRQKFINNRVAYSTINLNLYEVLPSESAPDLPFFIKIWQNFSSGSTAFANMFISIFYLLPFIIFLAIVGFGLRYWFKRRRE